VAAPPAPPPPEATAGEADAAATAPESRPAAAPAEAPAATFQSPPPDDSGYKGKVMLAFRQLLQNAEPAKGRIASAAVLGAGLTRDMAERLRSTLVGSSTGIATPLAPQEAVLIEGQASQVEAPEPPVEPAPAALPKPPKPEPVRSMSVTAFQVRQPAARRGAHTLTGLALGRGGSYLAYGRAEGSRLLGPPDFIRLDGRTVIPTAVRLAGQRTSELCGSRALSSWVQNPAEVSLGFTEELGLDGGSALPAARAFLKFLNYRLVEVLGPGAAEAGEGAATALSVSVGRGDPCANPLIEVAQQAGFPVVQLVPEPVAAVAAYLSRNADGPGNAGGRPAEAQHFLVIDWGSQGLDLSVVEDAPASDGPAVIDHIEHPLGGTWFDMILEGWLAEQLPAGLSDEDRRGLTLFARQFKEKASVSFAEGRSEHVQYCVLPVGFPPTRISITRQELEELFQDTRAHFESTVAEAPGRVGFQAEDFDQVVLVGGAARCYFARDAVRTALGRAPKVAGNPEEAIARGLVFWGAR